MIWFITIQFLTSGIGGGGLSGSVCLSNMALTTLYISLASEADVFP